MSATRDTYCRWVVNALRMLGPSRPPAVYDWVRLNEAVPAADLAASTSAGENAFEKNLRWARFDLSRRGVVISPSRGIWALAAP